MIDEANQSLEESGTPSHEIMVIVLHREFTAGSIGITLAGGADYESKDITVGKGKVYPSPIDNANNTFVPICVKIIAKINQPIKILQFFFLYFRFTK